MTGPVSVDMDIPGHAFGPAVFAVFNFDDME